MVMDKKINTGIHFFIEFEEENYVLCGENL